MVGLVVVAIVSIGAAVALLRQEKLIDVATPLTDAARMVGLVPRPRPTETTELARPTPEVGGVVVLPTPEPTTVPLERQYLGSVLIEPPDPVQGSVVTVTVRVQRNGQPVAGIPVYLVAHFRTVNERWPAGGGTVRTDAQGTARIPFNIGPATPGYTVRVEVVGVMNGQEITWSGSFTPRRAAPAPTPRDEAQPSAGQGQPAVEGRPNVDQAEPADGTGSVE